MNIGNKITKLRTEKGITVNKLANISGISQSYLRDIELGKKQPTIEYLGYICDGLGISLIEFFEDDNNNKNEIERLINKLNQDQKESLIEFLKSITK